MDLDDVLPHVGDWNRYQHILLWLVCLPACIPCGFNAFSQVFMDMSPDHWCKIPELIAANVSVADRKEIGIPKVGNAYSKCEFYDVNYTAVLIGDLPVISNDTQSIPCQYGWEYDTRYVSSSIVIDFDLVCSKSLYPTVALSALNLGGLFGVLIFGYLNDRIGRKMNYFLCLTVEILSGIATALAPDIFTWSLARFCVGLTIPAILHIPFVICLEVVAPSKRTLVSFYSNMVYVVGLVSFSGLAYGVRDWTWLALATSVPFLSYFVYLFFLPESLRWLLSQGKVDQVITQLEKVAEVNGRKVSDGVFKQFKETTEQQHLQSIQVRTGKQGNIMDLLRTPNMRIKTLIISFSWVVNETVYVGLSYYGPSMGQDPYWSFFLSALVEIPGYVLCLLLMDRWGRRLLLCFCMIVSGIAAISTALMPSEAEMMTLVLFLIAKCTIAGGTMVIFQFGGELYPTEVRGIGIGAASFLGK